jgi:hypothetical protein
MSRGDWLLVRRGTSLWGLPRSQVTAVKTHGSHRIEVVAAEHVLVVDEVYSLRSQTEVHPAGPVLRWATMDCCRGLAMTGEGPALLIDGTSPPEALKEHDD